MTTLSFYVFLNFAVAVAVAVVVVVVVVVVSWRLFQSEILWIVEALNFPTIICPIISLKSGVTNYCFYLLKKSRSMKLITLPKTNIAPENNHPFSGAMLVSGRVIFNTVLSSVYSSPRFMASSISPFHPTELLSTRLPTAVPWFPIKARIQIYLAFVPVTVFS